MNNSIKNDSLMIGRLKHFLYSTWAYVARYAVEKRRWQSLVDFEHKGPRVYYGHDQIPSRTERSGGAIIKFQDLNDRYPNTVRNANILYLVNSALPIFSEIMVREAKRHGAKFVLNQNGVAYPAWHGPGWEKTNRPNRYLLGQADYVIYQSEFCKETADKFVVPCQCPWTVLHNPVDTKVFLPNRVPPAGLRILLAGSHQHFYRIKTALEAFKYILVDQPDASLTIAGRYTWGESEQECVTEARCEAENLGLSGKVGFYGGYSQDEAPSLFQKHHILLHTKYNDPCPRLVVEAMACGLPIVFSKSGGVPELVGAAAGVGVPAIIDWEKDHPPQPAELAKAVLQILSSFDNYAMSARERASKYLDVESWKVKHTKIFEEVLKRKVK